MQDLELEMSRCRVCPRKCGADREHGKTGYCEKRPPGLRRRRRRCISGRSLVFPGRRGQGRFSFQVQSAVCLLSEPSYCGDGERKSDFDRAAFGYFLELQAQNANNINLVTPSHYVLQIRGSTSSGEKKGVTVPIVYNCGGYESVEAPADSGWADRYLPDGF